MIKLMKVGKLIVQFNEQLGSNKVIVMFKGMGSQFSACSFIKMLFFCWDMRYLQCEQYDHVIMLSKNQSALFFLRF